MKTSNYYENDNQPEQEPEDVLKHVRELIYKARYESSGQTIWFKLFGVTFSGYVEPEGKSDEILKANGRKND